MKAKHARQIRAGIVQARMLFPAYHLLTKLGKRAYTSETNKYLDRILAGQPTPFRLY